MPDETAHGEEHRRRAPDGTTHAGWGSGDPQLLVHREEDERERFPLTADETVIGSAADSDLVLPGADPRHATIIHDDRDEYVLTMHGAGEMNASPQGGARTEILRTGARFTMAEWTLVFVRAEYADHGRPYGGREGGEFSDQPPQPQRPDYRAEAGAGRPVSTDDDTDGRGWEVRNG